MSTLSDSSQPYPDGAGIPEDEADVLRRLTGFPIASTTDPDEAENLAMDQGRNGDLLLAMNEKLNALIETEVGEDLGQMLPRGEDATWTLDASISKLRM
jgi:hypothetical protein